MRILSHAVEAAACISTLRLSPEDATAYLREFAKELGLDFEDLIDKVCDEIDDAPNLYLLMTAASGLGERVGQA